MGRLQSITTSGALWFALITAYIATLFGYVTSAYVPSIKDEVLTVIRFAFSGSVVIPFLHLIVSQACRRPTGWQRVVRLLVPLLPIPAYAYWLSHVNPAAFWWRGLPLVLAAIFPTLIAAVYLPTGQSRPWLLQFAALFLALLPAFGAGRLAQALLLPKDAPLLVRDERTQLHWAPYICADPAGARPAALATGLVTSVAESPDRPPLETTTPPCPPPLLVGQGANGEKLALWPVYRQDRDQGAWLITGSTRVDGPRSREAALEAIAKVDPSPVVAAYLFGPLRPYWGVRLQNEEWYEYWLETGTVRRFIFPPVDPTVAKQLRSELPGLGSIGSLYDLEHPGWVILSVGEPSTGSFYVWVDRDRVVGRVDAREMPPETEAMEAARRAGYVLLPRNLPGNRTDLAGDPDHPAWELQAWELPSYRRVLLHYDWRAKTIRKFAP